MKLSTQRVVQTSAATPCTSRRLRPWRAVGGFARSVIVSACIVAAAAPSLGLGQAFPNRAVRLVTGGAPGSATDSIARPLAEKLAAAWQQPVIVENRTGAGGILSMDLVGKSAPDGYTLGIASTSQLVFNDYLFSKLPYNSATDFVPISELVAGGVAIVATPSFPANTLGELIALAKKTPDSVQYAVPQLGSPPHVIALALWRAAGVEVGVVPFRNAGDALTSVLGGQVPILFDAPALVSQYVNSGKLKAIAFTSSERSPILPSAPTLAESGFPSVRGDAWIGIVGPAQLPRSVSDEINMQISRALDSPELRKLYETSGWRVVGGSAQQFAVTIRGDRERWGKVIRDAGLKLD